MPKMLVCIDVPDINAALSFYTSALGLRLKRRLQKRFAELSGAPATIYLLQERQSTRAVKKNNSIKRTYRRHWTPVHLDFVVPDIKKAAARVLKAGAKMEQKIRKDKYGYLAVFSDPFGHGFCLIQMRGRGYGEIAE